jgi:hypothetical protein
VSPGAIMKRAACLILAQWALLGAACATLRTPDSVRDEIHARHTTCLRRVEAFEHGHGIDAMAAFHCDLSGDLECKQAGLEPRCHQWQSGGL